MSGVLAKSGGNVDHPDCEKTVLASQPSLTSLPDLTLALLPDLSRILVQHFVWVMGHFQICIKEAVHTCHSRKCLISHNEMSSCLCHLSKWVYLKPYHMPSVGYISVINSRHFSDTPTIEMESAWWQCLQMCKECQVCHELQQYCFALLLWFFMSAQGLCSLTSLKLMPYRWLPQICPDTAHRYVLH